MLAADFRWMIPGVLGGMSQPGISYYGYRVDEDELILDLANLKDRGVGALVSLTEAGLQAELVDRCGLTYLHLPVPDLAAPTIGQLDEFSMFVEEQAAAGRGVAAHCRAGLGRTGTVLAAFLVSRGFTARTALSEVRSHRPGAVETPVQEAAVFAYAAHCRAAGTGRGSG